MANSLSKVIRQYTRKQYIPTLLEVPVNLFPRAFYWKFHLYLCSQSNRKKILFNPIFKMKKMSQMTGNAPHLRNNMLSWPWAETARSNQRIAKPHCLPLRPLRPPRLAWKRVVVFNLSWDISLSQHREGEPASRFTRTHTPVVRCTHTRQCVQIKQLYPWMRYTRGKNTGDDALLPHPKALHLLSAAGASARPPHAHIVWYSVIEYSLFSVSPQKRIILSSCSSRRRSTWRRAASESCTPNHQRTSSMT